MNAREKRVFFDEARIRALAFDHEIGDRLGMERIWVRDLFGRITLYVRGAEASEPALGEIASLMRERLGAYAAEPPIEIDADVFDVVQSIDGVREPIVDGRSVFVERYLTGSDWLAPLLPNEAPRPPRSVLYGLKGGVGRSTALAFWARHLAERHQKKVLVIDLDLEAPGVGSMLLRDEDLSRFGVVDWLVEQAVGQADAIVDDIVATSLLGKNLFGTIHVVPAAGRTGAEEYLRKLNRVYLDLPGEERTLRFAERIGQLVDAVETHLRPDVVLIDSRAGLHDIAAASLTRLDALNLLFAVDTTQTWRGYRALFQHWQTIAKSSRAQFDELRGNLKIVAGQIPDEGQADYLERFLAHAQSTFECLYDEAKAEDVEAFAFDLRDELAPHFPLRIHWNRALQDYAPIDRPGAVTERQREAAFGDFFAEATALLLGAEGDES